MNLEIRVGSHTATFEARAVSAGRVGLDAPESWRAHVGLEFDPDQFDAQARLALGLFNIHRHDEEDEPEPVALAPAS